MCRRPALILALGIFLAAAGGLHFEAASTGAAPTPPDLEGAYILMEVPREQPSLFPSTQLTPAEVETRRKQQFLILRSDDVLNRTVAMDEVKDAIKNVPDRARWLSDHLHAEYQEQPHILKILVKGLPPEQAVTVVTKLASNYVVEANSQIRVSNDIRKMEVDRASEHISQEVERRRRDLKRFAEFEKLPTNETDRRATMAALYHERAELRILAARAKAEGKPKAYAEELLAVDDAIKKAERVYFEFDVMSREAVVYAEVSRELNIRRIQLDLDRGWTIRVFEAARRASK